jgi:hypothetical protein
MEEHTAYIIAACILVVFVPLLPKLVQARVWVLRKVHLFRLADWHERNIAFLVTTFRVTLAAVILVLLLLAIEVL